MGRFARSLGGGLRPRLKARTAGPINRRDGPKGFAEHAFPGPQGRFILLLCVGAALLVPVSAGASTASVDGGAQALQYVADPGEANLVRVMRTPGGYEIEDLGVVFPGAAAPRCSPAAPYRVDCSPPVSSIFIELGDRADAVNFASDGPASVNGGDGDDRIAGSRGSDTLTATAATMLRS